MITVKKGDRFPISWLVTNKDVSGASPAMFLKNTRAGAVEFPATCTLEAGNVVTHILDGTLERGTYTVRFEFTRNQELIHAPGSADEYLVVE